MFIIKDAYKSQSLEERQKAITKILVRLLKNRQEKKSDSY